MICAVIAEESIQAASEKIEQAALFARMIELRVDHLRDLDFRDPGAASVAHHKEASPDNHHLSRELRGRGAGHRRRGQASVARGRSWDGRGLL
jgi:hypothetical protein